MLHLNESEIISLAMKRIKLNQEDFSKLIGKSQGQISKYLSGISRPSFETYIHCMNIILENPDKSSNYSDLLFEISKLGEEHHNEIRTALLTVIQAYNAKR